MRTSCQSPDLKADKLSGTLVTFNNLNSHGIGVKTVISVVVVDAFSFKTLKHV
jgi:hypothetical protein